MTDMTDMNTTDKTKAIEWADLIIASYGPGWRVKGVIEASRAHSELSADFWVQVLGYVVAKTREKIAA